MSCNVNGHAAFNGRAADKVLWVVLRYGHEITFPFSSFKKLSQCLFLPFYYERLKSGVHISIITKSVISCDMGQSLNRKLEREMTVVTWNSWTPAEKKIFCQTPPRSRVAMLKHMERSADWSDFVDMPGFQSLPLGHWDICTGFRLVDGPPRLQGLDPTRGAGGLIRIISVLCRANGLGVRSPRHSF